jgi:hypothetical protein
MSVIFLETKYFIGLRVRRHVEKVVHEKVYSFVTVKAGKRIRLPKADRALLQKHAEVFDASLARKQLAVARKRRNEAKPSQRSNTAVSGISLGHSYDRYGDRLYKNPAYVVNCRDSHQHRVKKAFLLSVHGYKGAWGKAVRYLIKVKGIPPVAAKKLVARKPPRR